MDREDIELLGKRLDQLEEQFERLASERAIAQVMYRYIHACDELKDADRVASFFTGDAVWEGQGNFAEFGSTVGREAIHEMFVDNPKMLPFTAHFLTNPDIGLAISGDRGWGRWHTLEAATLKDGRTQVWMAAWYDNDFVKEDGEWRISHLRYRDRFVCPYEEGWSEVRYVSPQTLEVQRAPRPRVPGNASLGSLLIGSSHADDLKNWYRRAFDVSENEMGALEFGSVQVFIEEHSEVAGPTHEAARRIINLDVDNCRALEAHLREMRAPFVRPVEQTDFGLIATIADPDGNYVQIIQWGEGASEHGA